MKAGHTYKRLLAALTASALLAVDVHAASTDIFNQPLTSAAAISAKPNIMFILDNSGSMTNDYMPDDMDDSGKYGFKSSQCNGVAFDPTAAPGTYSPPLKADGTSYGNASFTAAASDGFDYVGSNTRTSTTSVTVGTGSKTVTIPSAASTSYAAGNSVIITSTADHKVWMAGSVTGWNGTTKVLTVDVTDTFDALTPEALRLAVAQIVTTATDIEGIQSVQLRIDGTSRVWPLGNGELTDRPLTAFDYPGLVESTQPEFPGIPAPVS